MQIAVNASILLNVYERCCMFSLHLNFCVIRHKNFYKFNITVNITARMHLVAFQSNRTFTAVVLVYRGIGFFLFVFL